MELEAILLSLRRDLQFAIKHWAIFEIGNGYPSASKSKRLHEQINEASEAASFKLILEGSALHVVSTIARMLDRPNGDRVTIKRFNRYTSPDQTKILVQSARNWNYEQQADSNEALVRKHLEHLKERLSEKKEGRRNISSVDAAIRDIRNKRLSHALLSDPNRLPTIMELRKGLLLIASIIHSASIALEGNDFNPRDDWKVSIENAKVFWNRYELGFT